MEYILIASPFVIAAYGFGYYLMRRVQAHLIEFFVTLVASTIPMGVILSIARSERVMEPKKLTACIFFGLLPVYLVIGGSGWGILVANRLRILGVCRRFAVIALGGGFVLGLKY